MKNATAKPLNRANLYFWLIEEELQRERVNRQRRKLSAMRRALRDYLKKSGATKKQPHKD